MTTDPAEGSARSLQAARAGSTEALGHALEACRVYLLGIADEELEPDLRAKGGASDIVQQTFLEAQRDFAGFHGASADELRAWLRHLLLNNVTDFTRRYRVAAKRLVGREVGLADDSASGIAGAGVPSDTPSPSGHAMAHEQAEALRRALERLPDDYRQVITWRYLEEKSFEEMAGLMQRSENAVRKLWLRAVERLRLEMDASP
jgi:RNA polymerase sigma-70 factor (ECF subfamily)